MDDYQQLMKTDIEKFLGQYDKHGFESKEDMVEEALRCLRERLRIEETFVIGATNDEDKM